MLKRINTILMMTVMLLFTACMTAAAQDDVTSDDSEVGSDSPAFVPMVKVGKALVDNDSIQYVELNTLYVYPKLTFKDETATGLQPTGG